MRCHRKSREMRNIGCHFQWPSSLWQPRQCWVNVSHSSGAVISQCTQHNTWMMNIQNLKFIFKKRTYLPFFKFFLVSRAMQLYFSFFSFSHSLSSPKPNHFCINLKVNWIFFSFCYLKKGVWSAIETLLLFAGVFLVGILPKVSDRCQFDLTKVNCTYLWVSHDSDDEKTLKSQRSLPLERVQMGS